MTINADGEPMPDYRRPCHFILIEDGEVVFRCQLVEHRHSVENWADATAPEHAYVPPPGKH